MILVTLSRTWFAVVSCLESRFLPSVSKLTYDFLWKTFTCINQFHPSDNSVSGRQLDSTSLFLSSLLSGPTSHFFCLLNMQSSVPRSSLCTWCSSYLMWLDCETHKATSLSLHRSQLKCHLHWPFPSLSADIPLSIFTCAFYSWDLMSTCVFYFGLCLLT